jgi:hypothetical protein
MSDFSFLEKIYKLLDDGGVFDPPNDSKSLEFKQTEELKAILDLALQGDGISDEKMEELYRTVIRYSIKFNHQFYQHELSGGYDPNSLAASWVSNALNNLQFTYEAGPVVTLIIKFLRVRQEIGIKYKNGSLHNPESQNLERSKSRLTQNPEHSKSRLT